MTIFETSKITENKFHDVRSTFYLQYDVHRGTMESCGGAFVDGSLWVHIAVFIKPVLQGSAKCQSFSPVCTIGVKGVWFAKDTRVAVCSVNMVTMNISSKHLASYKIVLGHHSDGNFQILSLENPENFSVLVFIDIARCVI